MKACAQRARTVQLTFLQENISFWETDLLDFRLASFRSKQSTLVHVPKLQFVGEHQRRLDHTLMLAGSFEMCQIRLSGTQTGLGFGIGSSCR